jgi:hypothetical protein
MFIWLCLGIPIFLLCLANLSGSLGGIFTFIYSKIDSINPIKRFLIRHRLERKLKRKQKKKQTTLPRSASKRSAMNASIDTHQMNVIESTLFGGSSHDKRSGNVMMTLSANDANSLTRSEFSSTMFIKELDEYDMYEEASDASGLDDDDDDDDDDDEDEYEESANEVPMSVALLVIFVYSLAGALLFRRFESWTLTQSAYFVYTTLTTIVSFSPIV